MKRFRTFRTDQATRDRYADVSLNVQDFIYPYFVVEGEGIVEPIAAVITILLTSLILPRLRVNFTRSAGYHSIMMFPDISGSQDILNAPSPTVQTSLTAASSTLVKSLSFETDFLI